MLVRIGSTTNHTGARPPLFQYFTGSSQSCCGGAGSLRAHRHIIADPIHRTPEIEIVAPVHGQHRRLARR
jgi:hypothetical protein